MSIFIEAIFDEVTGEYIQIDNRSFEMCRDFQLKEYKQRNAALGLLSQQEIQEMATHIQNIRTISNQKEQEILLVVWDGSEQTRSSACDAVQAVRWD
jgi:2-keto-4-pentenoate hydratase